MINQSAEVAASVYVTMRAVASDLGDTYLSQIYLPTFTSALGLSPSLTQCALSLIICTVLLVVGSPEW